MSRRKQAFAEHLLNNMTWPEKILWSRLRGKQTGFSFQRQAIVWGFVVDFWCATAKVVVELDGSIHERPDLQKRDKEKDEMLTRHGIKVLRFENSDVFRGMSAVLLRIFDACNERAPLPLKPYVGAKPRSRHVGKVEFEALIAHQEQKRLKAHRDKFASNYWKNRRNSVYYQPE